MSRKNLLFFLLWFLKARLPTKNMDFISLGHLEKVWRASKKTDLFQAPRFLPGVVLECFFKLTAWRFCRQSSLDRRKRAGLNGCHLLKKGVWQGALQSRRSSGSRRPKKIENPACSCVVINSPIRLSATAIFLRIRI